MDADFHDPHGTVECSSCDTLGRPQGGVTCSRRIDRVHFSHALPEGWALRDGALFCGACAAALPPAPRPRRAGALAAAVLERNVGPMSEDAPWPHEPEPLRARNARARRERRS